ncbi:MAG: DUF4838 domain-containing protein [Candidatus Sumerlaeota bacterium]|nr:DUF4838 domain-containing protein [Candidatus Sumerlaeota bacterium]
MITARLAVNGSTDWQIFVVKDSPPAVDFAAQELQRYVQQMSAASFRRVEKEEGKPVIVLGLRKTLSRRDRAVLASPAKGRDGYAITVRPADKGQTARIVIGADNERGAAYAVYDLLEKLGCRWFYPTEDPYDPEVVPRKRTLVLNAGSWASAAFVKHRICNGSEWFFEIDPVKALKQLDWAMKNRYNAMGWQCGHKNGLKAEYEHLRATGLLHELKRRGMYIHGPAHSFNLLLQAVDHMAGHPEWFGLRDGKRVPQNHLGAQFCWSNTGARKQFIANAREFIKDAEAIKIFCPIPFDGGIACACDECRKAGASNLLMTITGELTDMLAEARPDAILETTGGYGPTAEPPTGGGLHPKLRVIWAHWGRYHVCGYDDGAYDRRDNLEKWRKACRGGISLCQYYTDNFAEPWVIPPFAKTMLSDRKYFLRHRIDSVYMLMWPKDYWWNHTLNGYLAGRVFYDSSADPYDLIKDYAINYYGPGAGRHIAAYYTEWARDPELAYRVKNDTLPAHRAALSRQRKQYIDPAVKAAKNDPICSHRVGKVVKLHRLAEKLGDMYRQRDEIRALRARGKFARARVLLEKTQTYTDKLLDYFYELADLNQGLMDRKEVPWFIRITVKDWIEEERGKIKAGDTTIGHDAFAMPDETDVLPGEVVNQQ